MIRTPFRRSLPNLSWLFVVAAAAVLVIQSSGLAFAQTSTQPTEAAPPMEQRLARLCEQLEAQRQAMHIPGFAIAVVQNDRIILAKGFGLRDVEKNLPATEETLFAIGSSSKAFTSTLIGMLVDEGTMDWDDSVHKYLPDFHLHDAAADTQLTIRDLLCHRSGLSRTDLVWAAGTASRSEILTAIASAEPVAPFREKFNYNNVMFLAAGEAAAEAAGRDWDSLVAARIFKPLGMTRSNTTLAAAKRDPMLSLGYRWDEDSKSFKHLPMRDLKSIAPAGAINSTVTDMAKWIRLQLAKGEFAGKRLISEEAIEQTRTKHINMAGDIDYGMGWMLHKWNGHRVVEHGGNIDGFGAQVSLLPDDGLGYVLLTNVTATPLQQLSISLVFDALLGEWKESTPPLDLAKVEPYLGKYHFDALKRDVTVLIQNGRLAVDVPGQMVFELKPPDAEGKWAFDFPQPISVSFDSDDKGKVQQMKLYQAGLEFELPREGVTLPAEIDAPTAAKYTGVYHFEPRNEDWTVMVQNGRLAIDVPKQTIFQLRLPDADGKWVFRATKDIAVRFNTDDSGKVISLTNFQAGNESLLQRTSTGSAEQLPTPEEIIALAMKGSGAAALDQLKNVRMSGTVTFVNQGVAGKITMTAEGLDHFSQSIDLGRFGFINASVNGEKAFSDSAFGEFEELSGQEAMDARLQNLLVLAADWRKTFDSVEVARSEMAAGKRLYVVDLKKGKETDLSLHIDALSGLVHQIDTSTSVKGIGSMKTVVRLDDYRDVQGVNLPFFYIVENDATGKMAAQFDRVESNLTLEPDTFILKPAARPKAK